MAECYRDHSDKLLLNYQSYNQSVYQQTQNNFQSTEVIYTTLNNILSFAFKFLLSRLK